MLLGDARITATAQKTTGACLWSCGDSVLLHRDPTVVTLEEHEATAVGAGNWKQRYGIGTHQIF